jgi:hypothetical protein
MCSLSVQPVPHSYCLFPIDYMSALHVKPRPTQLLTSIMHTSTDLAILNLASALTATLQLNRVRVTKQLFLTYILATGYFVCISNPSFLVYLYVTVIYLYYPTRNLATKMPLQSPGLCSPTRQRPPSSTSSLISIRHCVILDYTPQINKQPRFLRKGRRDHLRMYG